MRRDELLTHDSNKIDQRSVARIIPHTRLICSRESAKSNFSFPTPPPGNLVNSDVPIRRHGEMNDEIGSEN